MHPRQYAITTPDKPALIMGHSGQTLSYAELESRSNQAAHLFRQAGLKRGDAVGIFMENEIAYAEIVWGCQRAGLYAVPISAHLKVAELAYIVADSGATMLVVSRRLKAEALEALAGGPVTQLVVDPAGTGSFDLARQAQPTDPIADESAGADMVYSSGTTGRPKGIRPALPDGAIDEETRMERTGKARYALDADSVYLSPAPLYHAAPLRWIMTVHRLGGTAVVMQKFDPENALQLIDRYGVTHVQFVPTHLGRLLRLPAEQRAAYDVSSLKMVLHAAAPCPVPVKERAIAWFGPILYEYYAGSEGNGITIISPDEWLSHKGSVGRAFGCEVKICDEHGEPVPVGTEGTIYFAGGATFDYHNDPEKTLASRNRYGWSTMGDVGRVDDEGFLYITDRKAFMIISGGVNVYPQEIEDLLQAHPKVMDAAVVGSPHADLGEQVTAVVQAVDASAVGSDLADELRAYLKANLSTVKVPKRVDFMAEIPRMPTGKLFKRLIHDAYNGRNPEVFDRIIAGTKS